MDAQVIKAKMDQLQRFGQTLPGAKVYYREDWGTIYFDLLGKQFGMMSPEASEDTLITLKNLPEVNESLREQFPGVIVPGYYANKTHWNSIKIADEEMAVPEIEYLIQVSYELVKEKLTKKQRAELEEN
ncbi:MmcQ/YjbR family DNA-binding protein [Enterococcus sp. DIV0876]|uniref:MmcQ/YjbR family DNA-binding protein n=1 Tax=Enterococcus sp. DIV0876 TaxID=2774633 RepID=UPI003D2FA603